MSYAGYLIRARPQNDYVEPGYLLHMLRSPVIREAIEGRAHSSSGVHNVNAGELATLKIPLPPLDDQRRTVRHVERAAGHAKLCTDEAARALALLDRLERSILARAFRGELVPQDASEEDAILPATLPAAPPKRSTMAARKNAHTA